MKSSAPSFERLEQCVTIIARHPNYPSKHEVVAECLEDIEDRWLRGQISLEQRFQLSAILLTEPHHIDSLRQPSDPERTFP